MEAQAHAELTFKPAISAFARACSQRHAKGQPSVSVWDRLYYHASKGAGSSPYQGDGTSSNRATSPQASARRVNTELLYMDAFDRKARRQAVAEQQQLRLEEVARKKCQTNARSR